MPPTFFLQDIVTFYLIISLSHNLISEKMSFGKYGGEGLLLRLVLVTSVIGLIHCFYINTRACLFCMDEFSVVEGRL